MQKSSFIQGLFPLCSIISLLCFCSTNTSTNLGNNITNTKPHFWGVIVDSADHDTATFSLPGPLDSGFGIHEVSGSYMIIGTDSGEQSAGYVRFPCLPDTNNSRQYRSTDSLRAIVLRFWNDTALSSFPLQVWRSNFILHANAPSLARGDTLLDSLYISQIDSINAPDSVVLLPGQFNGLADSIFKACTTSNVVAVRSHPINDTFGFIVANPNPSAALIRMYGNPQLGVRFKRGTDTATYINYSSSRNSYYIAQVQSPGSVSSMLSYASKKTAVIRYNATRLWTILGADSSSGTITTDNFQVISAFFPLYRPGASDTISLRYLVIDSLVHDGRILDTLFNRPPSPPGVITLYQGDTGQANAAQSLQFINVLKNQKSHSSLLASNPKLFLYLRLSEDQNQLWRKSNYPNTPLISVTAAASK